MKIPFRLIAALILLSLTGVFAYQAYWLTGFYDSVRRSMDNTFAEALQISDYNEMMLRCEALRRKGTHGLIEVSNDLDRQVRSSFTPSLPTPESSADPSLLLVNEPLSITIDKNGSVELLTKYFQRGIHSQLDLFTEVDLSVLDSLFVRQLTLRGIEILPHRIEVVDLRNDSTTTDAIAQPADYRPTEQAASYYYNYDLHNKMAYRLRTELTHGLVLRQMRGILCTSATIILLLGISFWQLIRVILRQKSLEEMTEDFTHNITHELKTPIAVAYAANDALLNFRGAEQPERRHGYLQIVQKQLEQLSGLVEQILAMSRDRQRDFRLHYETIALRPLLESLVEQHRLKADKPVGFSLEADERLTLRADRTHLYHMVSNLIDNAIKYSDGEADVRIAAFRTPDAVCIRVEDRGIGIPADKQKHVFDKFYRVPTGDRHEAKGYGLGLYYVRTLAEKHHGSIRLTSTPGKGSIFILQIPT